MPYHGPAGPSRAIPHLHCTLLVAALLVKGLDSLAEALRQRQVQVASGLAWPGLPALPPTRLPAWFWSFDRWSMAQRRVGSATPIKERGWSGHGSPEAAFPTRLQVTFWAVFRESVLARDLQHLQLSTHRHQFLQAFFRMSGVGFFW